MIKTKRVYEKPSREDGTRILVDRLWPRGISKGAAKVDEWMREIGPSDRLRRWFAHDPKKWDEFKKRYAEELRQKSDLMNRLRLISKRATLTLVYSAKNELFNQAVVLKQSLEES